MSINKLAFMLMVAAIIILSLDAQGDVYIVLAEHHRHDVVQPGTPEVDVGCRTGGLALEVVEQGVRRRGLDIDARCGQVGELDPDGRITRTPVRQNRSGKDHEQDSKQNRESAGIKPHHGELPS